MYLDLQLHPNSSLTQSHTSHESGNPNPCGPERSAPEGRMARKKIDPRKVPCEAHEGRAQLDRAAVDVYEKWS